MNLLGNGELLAPPVGLSMTCSSAQPTHALRRAAREHAPPSQKQTNNKKTNLVASSPHLLPRSAVPTQIGERLRRLEQTVRGPPDHDETSSLRAARVAGPTRRGLLRRHNRWRRTRGRRNVRPGLHPVPARVPESVRPGRVYRHRGPRCGWRIIVRVVALRRDRRDGWYKHRCWDSRALPAVSCPQELGGGRGCSPRVVPHPAHKCLSVFREQFCYPGT